ncbi:helix-turn-helix domain-containing protein [Streptomyces caelestis]|uniref:helix-turn-helix domain-containing protein n=1 Tax=Streptomyces caelestis TaxID=36816 RepID=UPI00366369A0
MRHEAEVRAASRGGDYGRVIELVRKDRRMTQTQLGQALGLSQPAVSRLEKRGTGTYQTSVLAAAAAHLDITPDLVGLSRARPRPRARDDDDMHRRALLGGAVAAAAAPALAALPTAPAEGAASGQAAALRLSTAAYRRLDASTPSQDLEDVVQAHLRLIQTTARNAGEEQRTRLAAVGSEAASLAGWLAWDMGNHGSARARYGAAVNAARSAGDPLLTAYQVGSLAQFEAHAGNGVEALNLAGRARRALGGRAPAVADAWLSGIEALGHAAAGDRRSADKALTRSRTAAEALSGQQAPPPWPWVFSYTVEKVAAHRVTCGAWLGLPDWALSDDVEALATGHAKQRALLLLDIAAGQLAAGRIEGAFALATRALEAGLHYRSGRIVERARAVRRSLALSSPPRVVRDFDERLHGVYL